MDSSPVEFSDIAQAHERIRSIVHNTPVLTSSTFNEPTGCSAFFKCENFQRTGSFKFRGATNAMLQLSDEHRATGVVTYSSGNHAQAIALAGKTLGIKTTIVMPDNAPAVKRQATADYGAEIVIYDPEQETREDIGRRLASERGLTLIPPYDHPHIVAGQGTAAKELIEEVDQLDALVVCCGGGGLLSGSALSARALSPDCRVIGVEPEAGDDATRSFQSGTLQTVRNPDTIADGARTPSLGSVTFPLVLNHVDEMVTVSDEQLVATMRFMMERMKIVVEPTGVLAASAVLHGKIDVRDKRVGIILSGGNTDLSAISNLLGHVEARNGHV